MGYFEEKIALVVSLLSGYAPLAPCKVIYGYPMGTKPTRLRHPRLVITLNSATTNTVCIGGDGKRVQTGVGITIYLPTQSNGSGCQTLYGHLMDCLVFSDALAVTKATADAVRVDSNADAYVMHCQFVVEEVL